jgi:ABC-type multidrug transport system fused ATPase/permease subunit
LVITTNHELCHASLNELKVQIIGTLVIIGIATPYTLVTFVPLIAMFFWTYRYFQATNRELKRLDSIARSPIYAYFEQCLNGLSTIRAYGAEGQVAAHSARRLDDQTRLTLALFSSNRWLHGARCLSEFCTRG